MRRVAVSVCVLYMHVYDCHCHNDVDCLCVFACVCDNMFRAQRASDCSVVEAKRAELALEIDRLNAELVVVKSREDSIRSEYEQKVRACVYM